MHWIDVPALREETHFDRKLRCFAKRPKNVNALFAATVGRYGDREALVTGRHRLDYGKLDRVAERLAGHLHRLGVARGDRVVLFLPNDRDFVYALLAVLRLGAVAVPVNVREQRPELAFILAQCGAKAIVFDAALADRLPPPTEGLPLAVRISTGPAPGATGLDELLEARSPAAPAADPGEEEPAVILYTSGTTGPRR